MNREQAINYLFSCGFTNEQVGEVVRALTYEPARLSVDEVTALAEWTEKLTKASEDAYNKGYADGVKAQEPRKGEWLRMSDLSEQEDDRYKCSCCGNVVHHKNKMNLYTFNSWCGRCGSDNGRHINYEVEDGNDD